jgi:cell division septum initiation protein DivIVA
VQSETAYESLSRRFNIMQAEANMLRAQRDELQRHATELESQVAGLLLQADPAVAAAEQTQDGLVEAANNALDTDDDCPI